MTGVGLRPSASAAGEHRRQGPRTTAGTTHARRARVEGAWASRHPAQGSRPRHRRLAHHPRRIQDISGKAQGRLWKRDRRLVARGPHAPVVTVAIARERAGFLGAIARAVPVTPEDLNSGRLPPATGTLPHGPRPRRRPGVVYPSAA